MPESVTDRVIAVIAKTMHMESGRITPVSTFEDLGIDSLDGINIAFGLENEFDVSIPDDALPKLRSVSDISLGIEHLLARKSGA
jgi:acyl carrier protein